jgi:hypothetical protein
VDWLSNAVGHRGARSFLRYFSVKPTDEVRAARVIERVFDRAWISRKKPEVVNLRVLLVAAEVIRRDQRQTDKEICRVLLRNREFRALGLVRGGAQLPHDPVKALQSRLSRAKRIPNAQAILALVQGLKSSRHIKGEPPLRVHRTETRALALLLEGHLKILDRSRE